MKAKYVPDLTRQMALGQSNYLRLYKLLPDLTAGVRREFELASSRGHQRIRLEVEEAFRYTSTVVMGVQEGHASPWLQSPELVIRLYHDARLARWSVRVVGVNSVVCILILIRRCINRMKSVSSMSSWGNG